jgi:hypothetical protein
MAKVLLILTFLVEAPLVEAKAQIQMQFILVVEDVPLLEEDSQIQMLFILTVVESAPLVEVVAKT